MAKKVEAVVKLQIQAGQASPAPPVGTALGPHGVNIVEFTKAFNAQTQDQMGYTIPVEMTIYQDKSFTFITKTPPAADLIKKSINLSKGSGEPNKNKVASISRDKLREIAELKEKDLNAANIDTAISMIAGTARSMGVTVED
mgnify:CR=1 FL=1